MKHITVLLTILCFSFFSAKAQEVTNKEVTDSTTHFKTIKPLQLIDGQILGDGLFFSINYDTRFKTSNKGLGLRAGVGILFGAALPVSINYLIGNSNKRSFLELGAGGTVYFKYKSFNFFDEN
ncbi:hypothetical protein [Pedobacter arcticus]|uniref:hypothetical protein n=1 Tax=Pedobacter arcticus TaxID=752140 RepID=UPI00037AD91D|nr:hypothetical protein [Pedobacter arcticus]